MPRIAGAILTILALSGCATAGEDRRVTRSEDAWQGNAIAKARCAGCHTIKGTAASPSHRAPSFVQIGTRHSRRGLLWELEAINEVGHYEMPATSLSPSEMRNLVAYIHPGRGG